MKIGVYFMCVCLMCLICTAVGQGRRLSPFLGEVILLLNKVCIFIVFFFLFFFLFFFSGSGKRHRTFFCSSFQGLGRDTGQF